MKKVSVIVPVYKSEKYLHRCIDSILNQAYQNIELILVDDGSPDNSSVICDEYALKDSRVKVIHKENKGVSAARNTGLSNSTGYYVMFVDSDDCIKNTMVGNLLKLLNNDYFDFALSGVNIITYADGVPSKLDIYAMKDKHYSVKSLFEAIIDDYDLVCICSPWGKLYKNSIIKQNSIEFNENIYLGEDTLFVLNYLRFCKELVSSKNVYYNYYRENYDSLFLKYSKEAFEFRELVFNEMRNVMISYYCSECGMSKFEKLYFSALFESISKDFMNFDKSDRKHKMKNIKRFINNKNIRKYICEKKKDKANVMERIAVVGLYILIKFKAKYMFYFILKLYYYKRRNK
ncbi:MAG: glycosyltransferase family 2 protein [Bacillota bacterium]|nr:glycosyltransferase family 2 protein [Bacillota bacterium]